MAGGVRVESEPGQMVPAGAARLRTGVHRPAGAGAWPVLLMRTPYGAAEPPLLRAARFLAGRGLAVVLQDVRGRYGSSGAFTPFDHEVDDGQATLAWLAAQPWCDGRVAGWGISYSTYTAAALCAGPPPPGIRLAGLVAVLAMANPYHHFYRGGALVRHWALPWRRLTAGPRSQGLAGCDPRAAAPDPDHDWLRWRSEGDAYWRRRDLVPALVRARLPMLHVGGWYDFALASTLALHAAMLPTGAPQRLVVGPWAHDQTAAALFRSLGAAAREGEGGGLGGAMLAALRAWLTAEPAACRAPRPGA